MQGLAQERLPHRACQGTEEDRLHLGQGGKHPLPFGKALFRGPVPAARHREISQGGEDPRVQGEFLGGPCPGPRERRRCGWRSFSAGRGLNGARCAAINPMARWETKLWEPDKFARLADRIQEELDTPVLFTGSHDDVPAIEEIRNRMKNGRALQPGRRNRAQGACLPLRPVQLS